MSSDWFFFYKSVVIIKPCFERCVQLGYPLFASDLINQLRKKSVCKEYKKIVKNVLIT